MSALFLFVLDWSLRASAVIAIGGGCAILLRNRSAATRNLCWRFTLAVAILLPIGIVFEPRVSAPAPAVFTTIVQAEPAKTVVPAVEIAPTIERETPAPFPWTAYLAGIYGVGALFLITRWLLSHAAIRLVFGKGTEFFGSQVRLATGSDLSVPVTFGLIKPVILLPSDAPDWPHERLEAALLHEKAHIARADWAWQCIASAATALHWFNPLFWLASLALERTSEAAADDEVLAAGLAAPSYAESLLSVAENCRNRPLAGAAMVGASNVKSRLKRILTVGIDRQRPRSWTKAVLGTSLAIAAALIAACTIAKASEKQGPTMSEISLKQGAKARIAFVSGPDVPHSPHWNADGKPASAADVALASGVLYQIGKPDKRAVVVCMQVSKLRYGDIPSFSFRMDTEEDSFIGGDIHLEGNKGVADAMLRAGFNIPVRGDISDVNLGIAASKFQLIWRRPVQPGMVSRGQNLGLGQITDKKTGKTRTVTKYAPGCQLTVPVSVDLVGRNLKLVAYDANGKELKTGGTSWPTRLGPSVDYTAGVMVESPNEIASVSLYAREYEWVKFTGVHLAPNPAP